MAIVCPRYQCWTVSQIIGDSCAIFKKKIIICKIDRKLRVRPTQTLYYHQYTTPMKTALENLYEELSL